MKTVTGSLLSPKVDGLKLILNIVSNFNAHKPYGFNYLVYKKYPFCWNLYNEKINNGSTFLGDFLFCKVESDILLANIIAKDGKWHPEYNPQATRYDKIEESFKKIFDYMAGREYTVHINYPNKRSGINSDRLKELLKSEFFDKGKQVYLYLSC